MIYIQHIISSWSKDSRGMPLAALRNQIPQVYDWQVPSNHLVCVQQVFFNEPEFKPEIQSLIILDEPQYQGLSWKFQKDVLEVQLKYVFSWIGSPKRSEYPFKLKIPYEQVGVFKINGRRPAYWAYGRPYTQHIFRIWHTDLANPTEVVNFPNQNDIEIDLLENLF
jgi:hypothetical protein